MFSVKITTCSLFEAVSKALATSKGMFYNKEQRDLNSLLLYARYSSIVKDIFYTTYQFSCFSAINEAWLTVAHWMFTRWWGMNWRKRTQENLSKFTYVIVGKSKESIPNYCFPLIHFFAFGIFKTCKTLEHQSGIRWERGQEGIGWDMMLFAEYYIFIFLNCLFGHLIYVYSYDFT